METLFILKGGHLMANKKGNNYIIDKENGIAQIENAIQEETFKTFSSLGRTIINSFSTESLASPSKYSLWKNL